MCILSNGDFASVQLTNTNLLFLTEMFHECVEEAVFSCENQTQVSKLKLTLRGME